MTEPTVKVRITGESSTLASASQESGRSLDAIGDSATRANARISASVADAASKVERFAMTGGQASEALVRGNDMQIRAMERLSESYDQQSARLRSVIQASAEVQRSAGGIAESQRSQAERSRELADGLGRQATAAENAAATQARMRATVDAMAAAEERAARSAAAAGKAARDEGADLTALLGRIDPVVKKLDELDKIEEQLRAARRSGKLGADDYDIYSKKLDALRASAGGAAEGVSHLSLSSAGARRELGVMFGEVARGNFAALEGSAITLANRSGLLQLAFSGVGLAIAAVFAAAVGLFAIYAKGEAESAALNRAIISTGNYAGVTAGQVETMAQRLGDVDGRTGEARDALTQLIATGKIAGPVLEDATRAALAFAVVTGGEMADGAREIAKLADEPSKAALELNERLHFLTATTLDYIRVLEQQGDQEGAAAVAMKAAADALDERRAKVVENAGYIERAWNAAKGAVLGFIDAMASIGRESTADDQLRDLTSRRAALQASQEAQKNGGFWENFDPTRADRTAQELVAVNAQIQALEEQKKVTVELAQKERDAQVVRDEATKALARQSTALEENASKQEKMAAAIAKVHADFARMRADGVPTLGGLNLDDAEAKRLQQVSEQYKDNSGARRATTDLTAINRTMSDLNNQIDAGLRLGDQLTDQYNGPLDAAAKKYAQQLDELGDAYDALQAKAAVDPEFAASPEYAAQMDRLGAAAAAAGDNFDAFQDRVQAQNAAILGNLATTTKYEQSLLRMTERERAVAQAGKQAADFYKQHEAVFKANGVALEQYTAEAKAAAGVTYDLAKANAAVSDYAVDSPVLKITDQIRDLRKALEEVSDANSEAFDPALAEKYRKTLDAANQQLGVNMVASYGALLGAARAFTTEGSKSYQQITTGMAALQIVQDALAMRAAIIAVLTQGEGEPYSAWARMAAMAAAVAPYLASIGQSLASIGGGGGSPSSQSAEVRQARQGTGSVLGDADAKSESIANAAEITANATQQLVGINRGMLDALHALQNALGAAGNQLARGAADADFPGTHNTAYGLMGPMGQYNPLLNAMTGGNDPIGNAIGSFLWGGKQKVIDQGIVIAGATLQEMLEGIVVGAYQTVRTSGGLFGHSSTDDQLAGVSADFTKQFQLVIGSIVDTVRAGALALGLLPEDIQAALDAYKIEETKISLKGLSAEEQQKELEAVFSKIFDGVAGAVVPFIPQFQRVGEGLGETLVRVATEVQVTQEGFRQLGIAIDTTDPERVAQISDALIEAAGGIDEFISGLNSFVANFSSDAYQLGVNSAALSSAFEQVGLTVPTTRDGMWALMQSLDATTEQGRKQIATLLRLSDVADQYYSQLDKFAEDLGLNQGGELKRELASIRDSSTALAQAMKKAGATEQELQRITDAAFARMKEAVEAFRSAAQQAAFEAGLTNQAGSLDQVNAEIERLQGIADAAAAPIHGVGSAIEDAANRARDAINLLIGDKSPLNDLQKLEVARGGLMAGAVTQDQFLEIARRLFGSTRQYETEFAFAQRYPGAGSSARDDGAGGPAGLSSEQSARLAELLEQQQQLQAASTLAQYRSIAQQYAQLADADGISFLDELRNDGIDIEKFTKGLGLDGEEALKAYGDNLKAQIDAQGESAQTIVEAIVHLGDRLLGGPDLTKPARSDHPHDDTDAVDDSGRDPDLGTVRIGTPDQPAEVRTMSANTGDMAKTLVDVRSLLTEILQATRDTGAEGVAATREVVAANREMVEAIDRAGDDLLNRR